MKSKIINKIKEAPKENYRIIKVKKNPEFLNGVEKVTVEYFYAKNDDCAYMYYVKYCLEHKGKFYWDHANRVFDCNGNCKDDMFDNFKIEKKDMKKNKYTFDFNISLKENGKEIENRKYSKSFERGDYAKCRSDMKTGFDDFKFLVANYDVDSSTTHNRSEYWSIDHHVMNDIAFNIKRLKENKIGCPQFCVDKARRELGITRNIDFTTDRKTDRKVMKLAMKLWDKELDELYLYIRLYQFYEDFGIDSEDKEIEKKYAKTIPYLKGTYKNIDYKKLSKLTEKYWKLWNRKFMEIGRNMWD